MAKISDLPSLAMDAVDGSETMPLVKDGETVQVTADGFMEKLAAPHVQRAEEAAAVLDGIYSQYRDPTRLKVETDGAGNVIREIKRDRTHRAVLPFTRDSLVGFTLTNIPGIAHVWLAADGGVLAYRRATGQVVELASSVDTLPAGGSTSDLLVRDPAAPGRAAFKKPQLALGAVLSPILNLLPNTLRTATLAPQVGYTAFNTSTYPQTALGRGVSIDKVAVCACRADGKQVGLIYSRATGALLEEEIIQEGWPKDDHNPPSVACYEDGTFVFYSSRGHNKSPSVGIRFRYPDETWSARISKTMSANACYPGAFLDRNGKLWLFIRVENRAWCVMTASSQADAMAGNFTPEQRFLFSTTQPYCHMRYDRKQHCFHIFTRPNSTLPSFGSIRRMRLDCATGELSDADGPLGRIDGTASGNGKTLPVNITDVAVLMPRSDGRLWNVSDFSDDGRTLMVTNWLDTSNSSADEEADESGTALGVWRLREGGNPYTLADYQRFDSVLAGAGTIGSYRYGVGYHIAQEPHAGFRFYAAIAGNPSRIERWDCPSGDGVTWSRTIIAQGAPGEIIARPMSFHGANETTPIGYAKFSTFDSYETYTGEEIRFVQGNA